MIANRKSTGEAAAAYARMLERQEIAPKPKRTAAQAREQMIQRQTEKKTQNRNNGGFYER